MSAKYTWHDYATEHKQCFVDRRESRTQATREEPAGPVVVSWLLYLPGGLGCVSCKTLDQARECAAKCGCTILL